MVEIVLLWQRYNDKEDDVTQVILQVIDGCCISNVRPASDTGITMVVMIIRNDKWWRYLWYQLWRHYIHNRDGRDINK